MSNIDFLRAERGEVNYPIYLGGVSAVEQLFSNDEMSVPLSVVLDERGNVQELIPGWSSQTRRIFSRLAGGTGAQP